MDLGSELEYMRRHKQEAVRRQQMHLQPREEEKLNWMRHVAHPPMLGGDLVFPQSLSPRGSLRSGVDITKKRDANAYNSHMGLWSCGPPNVGIARNGLWMGTCRRQSECDRAFPFLEDTKTSSQTFEPVHEVQQPEMNSNSTDQQFFPPPAALFDRGPEPNVVNSVDVACRYDEDEIAREFNDGFVTQIYNYLALGFPCVARYYDSELSNVSGIPVEELRQNDLHTDPKGYVMLSSGGDEGVCHDRMCERWQALRLYVRDWARNQSKYEGSSNLESWGVCERKGSWAG